MRFREIAQALFLGIVLGPGAAAALTIDFTAAGLGLATSNAGSDLTDDQSGLRTAAEDVGGSYLEINGSGLAEDAGADHLVTVTGLVNQQTPSAPVATWDYYFGVLTVVNDLGSGAVNEGGLGVRSFGLVQTGSGAGPGVFTRATSAGDPSRVDLTGGTKVEGGSIAAGSSIGQSIVESELIQFVFDGTYSAVADSLQLGLTGVSFSNDDFVALGLRVYLHVDLEGGDVVDGIFSSTQDPSVLVTDAEGRVTVDFGAITGIEAADKVSSFWIAALDDDVEANSLSVPGESFRIASLSGDFLLVPEPATFALLGAALVGLARLQRR